MEETNKTISAIIQKAVKCITEVQSEIPYSPYIAPAIFGSLDKDVKMWKQLEKAKLEIIKISNLTK